MKTQTLGYSRAYRFKRAAHYVAGYLSVMGLGFLFACLILGAVEYLLPLAVFMVLCAVISILSKPRAILENLDK
jgi:lipopolysaccharide export LptBFGC system permease protein LptF